mmetsp:Transcript_15928/g.39416  ORF Transcript_15928/g.39416 Transcript_15928/m.39416 type:complete len:239 (-) Transcript_15928:104-820(-)
MPVVVVLERQTRRKHAQCRVAHNILLATQLFVVDAVHPINGHVHATLQHLLGKRFPGRGQPLTMDTPRRKKVDKGVPTPPIAQHLRESSFDELLGHLGRPVVPAVLLVRNGGSDGGVGPEVDLAGRPCNARFEDVGLDVEAGLAEEVVDVDGGELAGDFEEGDFEGEWDARFGVVVDDDGGVDAAGEVGGELEDDEEGHEEEGGDGEDGAWGGALGEVAWDLAEEIEVGKLAGHGWRA